MTSLASAFALTLSLVFAGAALAKLRDRRTAASGFRSLGLGHATVLVPAIAAVELALSAALLIAPRLGALLAFGLLSVFTGVLVRARRQDNNAFCGCFGAIGSEPISRFTFARNAALMTCCLVALWATRFRLSLAAVMVVSTMVVTYFVAVAALQMAERTGSLFPRVVPGPNAAGSTGQPMQVGR